VILNSKRQPPRERRLAVIRDLRARTPLTVMVGGLGAVGQMLRRELKADLGRVIDIDLRCGCDARGGAVPGTVEHDLLASAGTVVLAVPETVALAVLPSLAPILARNALLVETLSVKSRFAEAIARERPRFEVIGINPMFGPSLSMAGRAVAVVPLITGARADRFISLIAARGAEITELSAESHDSAAAALQVLPHIAILAFARAFASCRLDLESALRIAPPPASAMLALAARMASGNPQVYYEIQSANPFARAARDSLVQAIEDVLDAGTDADAFRDLLADVTAEFGDSYSGLLNAAERLVREQRPPTVSRSPSALTPP
jgi:prephenate dehydrogenase